MLTGRERGFADLRRRASTTAISHGAGKKNAASLSSSSFQPGGNISSGSGRVVQNAEPPKEFVCPITMCLMSDPVRTADGFVYERSAIADWLRGNDTSPMTNAKLASKAVASMNVLRHRIDRFRAERPTEAKGHLPSASERHQQRLLSAQHAPSLCGGL